jgi:hypothetical protein
VKRIEISDYDIVTAKAKASEMGTLRNSITKGKGNVYGFLGEILVFNLLKKLFNDNEDIIEHSNTYDYDLIFNRKAKLDVKTKVVSTPPQGHYECSVAALNPFQKCDAYVFTRVLKDMSCGWVLGWYDKKQYFKEATFLKKGQVDPSNNWTVRTDCYNLPINILTDLDALGIQYGQIINETH